MGCFESLRQGGSLSKCPLGRDRKGEEALSNRGQEQPV